MSVTPAQVPGEDADAKREFKYPYLACEIFCCEVHPILGVKVQGSGFRV
jgi:hypothetical protein